MCCLVCVVSVILLFSLAAHSCHSCQTCVAVPYALTLSDNVTAFPASGLIPAHAAVLCAVRLASKAAVRACPLCHVDLLPRAFVCVCLACVNSHL